MMSNMPIDYRQLKECELNYLIALSLGAKTPWISEDSHDVYSIGDDDDTDVIHGYIHSSDILDVLKRMNEGGSIERTALNWRARWTEHLPYSEAETIGLAAGRAFVLAYYGPRIEIDAIVWKKKN